MSTLQENLNKILAEKQTKILGENIKRGVQMFDVVGTLDIGMTPDEEFACNETALQILGEPTNLLHRLLGINFEDASTGKLSDNFTLNIDNVDYKTGNTQFGKENVLFRNYGFDENGNRVQKHYTLDEILAICPYVTLMMELKPDATEMWNATSSTKVIFSKNKPTRQVDTWDGHAYTYLMIAPWEEYETEVKSISGYTTETVFYENVDYTTLDISWGGLNGGSGEFAGKQISNALNSMNSETQISLDAENYEDRAMILITNYII